MIYQLDERIPDVEKAAFIAESADVIGSVIMEEDSSIWFNVVARADLAEIRIGARSNIQDGSVLHVEDDYPLIIGQDVTVGHKVMLHGCTIGEGSLIGINAVVLDGAKIGKGCLIGANALVTENMVVPDYSLVLGSPGKIKKELDQKTRDFLMYAAQHYVENSQRYSRHLTALSTKPVTKC